MSRETRTLSRAMELYTRPPARGDAFTKIVATIGPASEHRIGELIEAGMDVARINFSHGSLDEHRRRIETLRSEAAKRGVQVGVLADIRGPKLRLGKLATSPLFLKEGSQVELVAGQGAPAEEGELTAIPLGDAGLIQRIEPGQRVLLADGVAELLVEERGARGLIARVKQGGRIADDKGVHLPDTSLDLAVPTLEDRRDLTFCREVGVDFCGISFVSGAEEVEEVRAYLPDAWMVAKIERAAALENLDEIVDAADGVMVARGDLGVELNFERLPAVQKAVLHTALERGKFTITATEMLESMVTASRPTRAEVSDVAHAVLDGTDAVMLSAETAVGADPPAAVRAMNRIARSVEKSQHEHELPRASFRAFDSSFSNAIAMAAADSADLLQLEKIICFTETGATPRKLSLYRPQAEVVALSPHTDTLRRMSVLAHVRPVEFSRFETLEDMLEKASAFLLEAGRVKLGERVCFVAGVPPGVARSTNVLKLHRIGDPIKLA